MKLHSAPNAKSDEKRATVAPAINDGRSDPRGRPGFRRLLDSPRGDEITTRLRSGMSAESVAEWLHVECGVFREVSRTALIRQLYRYRNTLKGAIRPNKAHVIEVLAKEKAQHFIALHTAIDLTVLQMHRLGRILDREQLSDDLLPEVGPEMDRLARMLQFMSDLKVRSGLLHQEGEAFMKSVRPGRIAEKYLEANPESRPALMKLSHHLGTIIPQIEADLRRKEREAAERLQGHN